MYFNLSLTDSQNQKWTRGLWTNISVMGKWFTDNYLSHGQGVYELISVMARGYHRLISVMDMVFMD